MPRIWFILLFLTLACSHFLRASGELVYSKTENRSYIFRYLPGETNTVSNYLLKELARHYITDVKKVSYTLFFDEKIEIYREKNDNLRLSVSVENCRFEGFSTFEGYALNQVLLPSATDFEIHYNTGMGDELLKFTDIPFKNAGNEILSFEPVFNGKQPLSIQCDWKKFDYSPDGSSYFDETVKRIYNYLAAKYILDLTLDKAKQIDFSIVENLPFTWLQVMDVRKNEQMLKSGQFDTGFIIDEADRENFVEKMNRLSSHAIRLNTLFEIVLDSLDNSRRLTNVSLVSDSLIAIQLKYLDLTTEANHYFAPLLTRLAEIASNKSGFEELIAGLDKFRFISGEDHSYQTIRDSFLQQIFQDYIRKADCYISSENFVYAITLLENARELCTGYQFDCSDHLFQTISKAKYGIYYSYLSIAGQAFDIGRIPMAERYLKQAAEFQKSNSRYIVSDMSVQRYYDRLLVKMVEEARTLLLQGKPEQALENLSKADEYCAQLHPGNCGEYVFMVRKQAKRAIYKNYVDKAGSLYEARKITEAAAILEQADTYRKDNTAEVIITREYSDLLMKIRLKEYEQLLGFAQDALQQNDPEGSRVFSKKALELQSSYGFEKTEILETLVPASRKFEIRQKIDSVNGWLWDRQLSLAERKIKGIRDEISLSFLDTDMEVMRQFHRIDSLYTVISCRITDEKFSILLLDAERNYHSGNFPAGYKQLVQASEIQASHPACSFDGQFLIKMEQLYQPYSVASTLFNSARSARNRKEYLQAVQDFQNAWNTSADSKIRAAVFGEDNLNIFVNESGDPEFYERAAVYLKDQGLITQAFSLVKYGFHKGIVIRSYRNILETSGAYYAAIDFGKMPGERKSSPGKYTGDDKWLQEFTRAYHKRWKELESFEKK